MVSSNRYAYEVKLVMPKESHGITSDVVYDSLRVIVDTGAPCSVFSIAKEHYDKLTGSTPEVESVVLGKIVKNKNTAGVISINGVEIKNFDLPFFTSSEIGGYQGIIGVDVLKQCVCYVHGRHLVMTVVNQMGDAF